MNSANGQSGERVSERRDRQRDGRGDLAGHHVAGDRDDGESDHDDGDEVAPVVGEQRSGAGREPLAGARELAFDERHPARVVVAEHAPATAAMRDQQEPPGQR